MRLRVSDMSCTIRRSLPQDHPSAWVFYSVAINLGSSLGLLGQWLAAIAAHRPRELLKLIATKYRTQTDGSPGPVGRLRNLSNLLKSAMIFLM